MLAGDGGTRQSDGELALWQSERLGMKEFGFFRPTRLAWRIETTFCRWFRCRLGVASKRVDDGGGR